jgi:hypothetical protein
MGIKTWLIDGRGTNQAACVTSRGELVVGDSDYSTAYTVEANIDNTAFNFVGPISNKRFVITSILLYANKGVGAADASVQVYEADADDTTTVSKTILDLEMLKNSARDITGIRLIVTEGKWVNIKTDDNTIFATIMGYYVTA